MFPNHSIVHLYTADRIREAEAARRAVRPEKHQSQTPRRVRRLRALAMRVAFSSPR